MVELSGGVLFLPANPQISRGVLPDDLPALIANLQREAKRAKEFGLKTQVEQTFSNEEVEQNK